MKKPLDKTEKSIKHGGRRPGSGRKPGSVNKIPRALKETILESLEKAGGAEYLMRQADENPQAYMQLIGKVLPQDVHATVSTKPWTPDQAESAVEEAIIAAKTR